MNNRKYCQAEYMLAIMSAIVEKLRTCGAISEEQERMINALNKQTVFVNYSSAIEVELAA